MAIPAASRTVRWVFLFLFAAEIATILFYNDNSTDFISGYFQEANRTQIEYVCKIPQLLVDDPLIKRFLRKRYPLKCIDERNWVYTVGDGRFYIDEDAISRHGEIECNYSRIDRKSDWDYEQVDLGNLLNGTELKSDTYRVICETISGSRYDLHHITVPNPSKEIRGRIEAAREKLSSRQLDLNVMIYLMDSVSRVNFIRQCPKFHAQLTEKMGAYVMEGFNTVGDGTPWTIIPLTTGHFQTELPEARKRLKNASYLDDWPLIFKNYIAAGYVTSFVEEMTTTTAYNFKLKGFNKAPVDHYLRTFLLAADKHQGAYPYCVGDTPRSIIWCKFWRELQTIYGPIGGRHFSMLFSGEVSHNANDKVQMLDGHCSDHFRHLFEEGFFNDTLLIVMGDHGLRFGPMRQTQSGKLEEKLPFLAIVAPPWFKQRFPKSHENLLKNQHRLVTAFDLHATLLDVLDFHDDGGVGNVSNRGISLFQEIPAHRTCAHAHIKPHYCTCLEWADLKNPNEDRIVLRAAGAVIDYFNQQLREVRGRCAKLALQEVIGARLLKPKDQLMFFKESIDFDNYQQDLSAKSALQAVIYQVRFITKPGGADFEASVSYFMKKKKYLVSADDISRLNAYSDQAACVINTYGHLRTFCYCY